MGKPSTPPSSTAKWRSPTPVRSRWGRRSNWSSPRAVELVITEGNYLLLDTPPWSQLRELLDEVWFLAPDDEERVQRLIRRHIKYGKTPEQAEEWVHRSDERNARLIAATRPRADLVVDGDPVG